MDAVVELASLSRPPGVPQAQGASPGGTVGPEHEIPRPDDARSALPISHSRRPRRRQRFRCGGGCRVRTSGSGFRVRIRVATSVSGRRTGLRLCDGGELELALSLIGSLRPVVDKIRRCSPKLARQLEEHGIGIISIPGSPAPSTTVRKFDPSFPGCCA